MEGVPLPLTPSQTVGPFFHGALIREGDAVLVDPDTPGERIRIVGRVLDGDGVGVDDAVVEIWQADAGGAYPSDAGGDTTGSRFRGFGRSATVDGGRFTFDTIKPGAGGQGGTAPSVNIRVFARGLLRDLVTRMYFPDEANGADPVLMRIDPARRSTLVATLDPEASGLPTYRFDIHLQGPGETVFFELVEISS